MKLAAVSVAVVALVAAALAAPARAAQPVSTIKLDGVISPVTVRLVETALARAQAERAGALVIELDTPGGLERSMRSICQRLLNAELPVIVYVAPTGARAASAGVFITMAAHVAAMAPATNIGAAHPVALSGGVDKESMKKIENDAAAFARTIAVERGRNAEWAEKAVRQSVSITEREAVRLKVVDLVADSLPDLLDKIDGRTEVRVLLRYDPPAGALGATVARLFGEAPQQQIREDLYLLKRLIENPSPSLRVEGDRAIASPS